MRKYSEIVIPRREGNSCQVVTEIGHTGIAQPPDNSVKMAKMCKHCYVDNSHVLQHCMYETESSSPASLPSDDIWKKFELIPTPPRSPEREEPFEMDLSLDLEDMNFPFDANFFESEDFNPKETFAESPPSQLCSKLIQDCMWSGDTFSSSEQKDKTSSSFDMKTVDPMAVFPCSVTNNTNNSHSIMGYLSETKLHSLGTETPSDSEEEIDVVTVEKLQQNSTTAGPTINKSNIQTRNIKTQIKIEKNNGEKVEIIPLKTTTLKIRVETPDLHNYSLPHSHQPKRVRSYPVSPSHSPLPQKRTKKDLSVPDFKRVCQKLRASKSSSDSEECISEGGKRTQHNVLERKRRNDLKYSFFTLRDSVPELSNQERAPKVLILKKASDYVHSLNVDNKRLESEKATLLAKQQKLKRTLEILQDSDFF
ncbi:Myc proto-oncogene protein [Mytilus galloprovincialis]|nr:Myc proto-oncogene protein [Mytilus galloprovincialis]